MLRYLVMASALASLSLPAASEDAEVWHCPAPEVAKAAFADGSAAEWPNYSEGAAARVQRQHPDTAIVAAQAKFIAADDHTAAICQYYTHIGVLFMMLGLGPVQAPLDEGGADWREEYTESHVHQDKPGKEMMSVCVRNIDGEAFPSTDCGFTLPD
jgi:hypothetical protein